MKNYKQETGSGLAAGNPLQLADSVGTVKALLFLCGPWVIFAGICAISAGKQTLNCWLFGLAITAVCTAAWKLLGSGRLVLYMLTFLVSLALFRIWYLVGVPNELSGDEALYWTCSRHLDWCYVTKGPGVAFCIWCSRMLLGDTELGVRAPAVIFSLGSSLILYLLGRRLHNPRVGVLSAVVFQVIPVFAFLGLAMTTDPLFVFMWLLALLFMLRVWQTGSALSWVLTGLAVGTGILCKYTMAAFLLPALLLLVFSPARRQLLTPWPYLGLLVCLAATASLIIWNANHDWINFFHNAGQTKVSSGLRILPGKFFEFVGSQLGIITPILLIMMVWAAIKLRRSDPFSFWFSVPLMVLFTLKSIQGKVQPNWALCSYLTCIISFSAYFPARFTALSVGLRRLTVTAVALAVCFTIFMHTACLIQFPPDLDPLKKVRLGSVELAREVTLLSNDLGPRRFIFTDKYMTSSLLAFYMEGRPTTYCVNLGRRINDYDLRPGFHDFIGYDAIYVTPGDKSMPDKLIDKFAQYEKRLVKVKSTVGSIENVYSVFICRDFKGMERKIPTRYN
jgi:hypothetical protein